VSALAAQNIFMPSLFKNSAEVHFGSVGNPLPNWRKNKALKDEEYPDDEEMETTPSDQTTSNPVGHPPLLPAIILERLVLDAVKAISHNALPRATAKSWRATVCEEFGQFGQ